MTKKELTAAVAEKATVTKKDTEKVVNALFDTLAEELAKGEKIAIAGFGAFEVRARAEHQGRNPATGEAITIPAAKVPAFKAGKQLKEQVNA